MNAVSNLIGRLTQTSSVPPTSSSATVLTSSTSNMLGYDALGRITPSSQTTSVTSNGATQTQTYTFPAYTYNRAGALTSETLPSGRVISTGYDLANRPVWL